MSEERSTPKLHIEGDWKKSDADDAAKQESSSEASKLHIDSDWKAEAQREKERLVSAEAAKEKTRGAAGGRGLPDANFKGLMSVLASQAIMGLGAMTDPQSGGVIIDLETAKFSIDLLEVLEEKTKGNLSEEENSELTKLTAELRSRFVQITQLVAQQATAGGVTPVAGGGPGIGGPGPT